MSGLYSQPPSVAGWLTDNLNQIELRTLTAMLQQTQAFDENTVQNLRNDAAQELGFPAAPPVPGS